MKLTDWLIREEVTQVAFGERIGTSQVAVSKLSRGMFWPSGDIITAIERETGGKVTAADILATYQEAQSTKAAAE